MGHQKAFIKSHVNSSSLSTRTLINDGLQNNYQVSRNLKTPVVIHWVFPPALHPAILPAGLVVLPQDHLAARLSAAHSPAAPADNQEVFQGEAASLFPPPRAMLIWL
jgi:hypothetical protein